MKKSLVLVVDDEKQYADLMAEAVRESDKYDAIAAYSGIDAFKVIEKNKTGFGKKKNKIGCILLDIKMPGMDGLQFMKKLRDEYGEMFKVILVTAYEDQEKWGKALDYAAVKYIRKPFREEYLLRSIDTAFTLPSAVAQLDMIRESVEREAEGYRRSDATSS